jgi:hypothetical protein
MGMWADATGRLSPVRVRAHRSDLLSDGWGRACLRSGEEQLRATAESAWRLVLSRTYLDGPVVAAALRALLEGRFGPGPERAALGVLAARGL